MIKRIKQVIQEFYGEQAWFLICLRTGGWQHYPGRPGFSYDCDEWRIELDRIKIDIQELSNGRYRVVVGIPTQYSEHFRRWEDVEFAHTSERDTEWEYRVRLLLADANNHPNVVCDQPVI